MAVFSGAAGPHPGLFETDAAHAKAIEAPYLVGRIPSIRSGQYSFDEKTADAPVESAVAPIVPKG